jgi:ParB/RepB/Spo0J family partition protein
MRKKSSAPRRVSRPDDAIQPEHQPALVPSKVRNIALSLLVLSPANVRKTPPTAAEDAELEASIRARGILQNLIVHPAPVDGQDIYQVDAGGRRLKVLQKLAAEGVIEDYHPVPCLVREPAASLETSLMENTVRAAMHPADEFVAMAALIDGGATIDEVAKRFGTSERHVKQRLRLGKLAPELLDAYRNGDISLDVVTAFTLGADHAAQLAVWNQLKDNSYIQAYTVKRLLTASAVPLYSDLGMFVGAEAYEAASGKSPLPTSSAATKTASSMMPRWCAGWQSRSSKPRPRNCARNGPGPKRCSISNTAFSHSTPASRQSVGPFPPNWRPNSSRSRHVAPKSTP